MRNLFPVAKYESIMLLRTWKFWILAILGMFFPIMMNVVLIIIERVGENLPGWLALEGARPYFFFNFYNTIQISIVIFLTSDFREKDKKHHVDMVMSSKSMTNFEYIAGKYFGIVIPLIILTFGVLFLLIILNRMVNGVWLIEYYITFFLIMNLPGLLFITGFVIFASSLLRNTAVVFIVVLIYTVAMWKVSMDHAFEVNDLWMFTDYIGTFLPLYPSDLMGIVGLKEIILQRVFYVLIGFFFLGMTIALFYPRLQQSVLLEWLITIASVGCLAAAGSIMLDLSGAESLRQAASAEMALLEKVNDYEEGYAIKNYQMKYEFYKNGKDIYAESEITIEKLSDKENGKIPLVLNPGLELESIKDENSNDVTFEQKGMDILLNAGNSFSTGEKRKYNLVYSGTIDDKVVYLNRGKNDQGELEKITDGPVSPSAVQDRIVLLTRDFSYLLPTCYWYPTLYNPYKYKFPKRRPTPFFTGDIEFVMPERLTPVTQGVLSEIDSTSVEGKRIFQYDIEVPVKSLSFASGEYDIYSREIAGINLNLIISEKHNSLITFFEPISTDIYTILGDVFRAIREITGLEYPYKSLTYVEVPITIQWYQNNGLHDYQLSNSGVVFTPEYSLIKQFKEHLYRRKRRAERRGIQKTDEEIKKELFINLIVEDMFSENWWNDDQLPVPLSAFWSDRFDFDHEIYPAYQFYFDKFLQGIITDKVRFFVTSEEDPNSVVIDAESSFQNWRFEREYGMPVDTMNYLVRNFKMSEIEPETEKGNFHSVMKYKGQRIHKLLREFMTPEKYKVALRQFITEHSFKTAELSDIQKIFEDVSGSNLGWYFEDWLNGTAFPGFLVKSLETYKIKGGKNGVQYFVDLTVKNGEPDFGFVKVMLRTKGDEVAKSSEVRGGQEVRFGFVLDDIPETIYIDPIFSQNNGAIRMRIQVPDRFERRDKFDGVELLDVKTNLYESIVVDDMDDGFSLERTGDPKFLRPKEGERNWRVRTDSDAFGKYKLTYRTKRTGTNMLPAEWKTEIPASGTYDVEIFLMKPSNEWWMRRMQNDMAPEFTYTIEHADGSDEVKLSWIAMPHGWSVIGRYTFDKDQGAVVRLEDIGRGMLMADAVRFTPVRLDEYSQKE